MLCWLTAYITDDHAVVLRRTLAQLFTGGPLSTQDLIRMRHELQLLGEDLASRVARIPEPPPQSLREPHSAASYEDNPALNRWARLLLSAFMDQRYCVACHPVLKIPASQIWADLYPT